MDTSRQWYRHAFDADYLCVYAHRDAEAAAREVAGLLVLAGMPAGARILDVCCGAGRHLAALCAAGMDAIGFDLSATLLATACRSRAAAGRLVRGDMRALPFDACFRGVFNLFSSFGYFAEDRENEAALAEMARVLVPGGVLLVDHMNRERVARTLVPRSEEPCAGGTLVQERRIEGDRVIKERAWRLPDGTVRRAIESVRMYTPEQFEALLAGVGLVPAHVWGDADGASFDAYAPRMIVAASKAGG